jgi:hypothetical protein
VKRNIRFLNEAVARHRLYCMSCGTHLAQAASRRVGLCQACRRHCVCCGRKTGIYGYYDVCPRCRPLIEKTIEYMDRHNGKAPTEKKADDSPPRRANCVSCGEPAEMEFDGRPYCEECYAEKENGGRPCANCGGPECAGECERDESDQT